MTVGIAQGNLTTGLPKGPIAEERFGVLAQRSGARIERIISTGQTTPEGEWCVQNGDEWVLVVSGAARLRIEGEDEDRALSPGDWVLLPAHCRHRVTWTRASPPTVWLAVHL